MESSKSKTGSIHDLDIICLNLFSINYRVYVVLDLCICFRVISDSLDFCRHVQTSLPLTSTTLSQVSLVVGSNVTVELTDIYLIGPLLASPPRFLMESKTATVIVPEQAANAQVCTENIISN